MSKNNGAENAIAKINEILAVIKSKIDKEATKVVVERLSKKKSRTQ